MNCVIIEDEAIAARRLKMLIENHEVKVNAILHSVKEAINWLSIHTNPDLIFLDIQLGDGLSFEIFEEVQPQSSIIFTTAYDEYALRAFKLNSIDYLLKPIQEKELINALNKFKSIKSNKLALTTEQIQKILQTDFNNKYKERFLVQIGAKMKTIETNNISLIYSENKGTYVQEFDKRYLLDQTLDEIETLLNPSEFYRISRKAIVKLTHIEDIISYAGSRLILKIKGNKQDWIVSRERVKDFKAWLDK